jgi:hypothetical protein
VATLLENVLVTAGVLVVFVPAILLVIQYSLPFITGMVIKLKLSCDLPHIREQLAL